MADGLFDLLEKRIYKVTDDFKGELKTYLRKKKNQPLNNDWHLIYDQASQSDNYMNLEKSIQQSLASTMPMSIQQQFSDTANNFGQ